MKSLAISGSSRENVGKRDARELRYQGLVPAVLYGGEKQIHFSVSASDLRPAVYTAEAHFVELEIDGKKYQSIVQDIQFHPLTDQITHIDFLELHGEKTIGMSIPVRLTGTSPGVRMGGKLIQKLRNLQVRAIPGDMPDKIEVSIDALNIGSSVRVEDIKLENAKIKNNADDTIVSVITSRVLTEAEDEETEEGEVSEKTEEESSE